ncbi:4-hydroxy-tetrahydrodipicolinate reductase [Nitratireductor soli]|uniref:4-hydroxy-tetrahydrodipicolinate reductase n=1 Tax=Nitratireductor soli TaxID=1670619 RepID=UPI00065E24C1|nr:dihydrodipicolinate reductase C-terminal domain-containing protein [Nitratireductor soli]
MRIAVIGAAGRVGTKLVEAILAGPGLELAAAIVSPGSRHVGMAVAGGSVEYRPADAAMNSHCDVMIDFSTPAAALALQAECGSKPIPIVVGTTGFTATQEAQLSSYARVRPLLVSANFAIGFEAFLETAAGFAAIMPGAEPTVAETYPIRKKAEPSGTSLRLAAELRTRRTQACGLDAGPPPILVRREGDVVGVAEIRFDLGSAEASFVYRVHTLAAYAEGALAAARWLVEKAPGPGRYSLSDALGTS